MKLLTKLTLFATLSKLAIVLLFVWLLPLLVDKVAMEYANLRLRQQEKKVFKVIQQNGIEYYLEGDSTYGSYTMLKEEYVSLERNNGPLIPDTILNSQRILEGDTLNYRTLISNFEYEKQQYTLEIGKTVDSIRLYNAPLQRIALWVLACLVLFTLLFDLSVTRILLSPLRRIIRSRLVNTRVPFTKSLTPVKTSTSDFRYLDESLIRLMQTITDDFERERAFTSNASHELMTPISILQTKLENLMLNSQDEATQEKVLEMMKILNRLKKIVNSLLMISRIENAQYLRSHTIKCSQLIPEITHELAGRMANGGLTLSISLREDIQLVRLNQDLVFHLFYNIINNAIRYNTEGGQISISDSTGPEGEYRVHVSDTGAGIPAEEQERIFNRFSKSGLSRSDGHGLGLSIVKSIVNYHGLHLSLQSEPGRGSTFTIGFPAGIVEKTGSESF